MTSSQPGARGLKRRLPTKVCMCCHRPMTWRRAWAKNWEQVVSEADVPLLIRIGTERSMGGEFASTRMSSPRNTCERFAEDGYSSDAFERLMIYDEHDAAIGDVTHFSERSVTG